MNRTSVDIAGCDTHSGWAEDNDCPYCVIIELRSSLAEKDAALLSAEARVKELEERIVRHQKQLAYYSNVVCFDSPQKWWAIDGADAVPAVEPKRLDEILSRIRQLEGVVEWAIEASLQLSRDINSGMVEQFSNALRRREGVKE